MRLIGYRNGWLRVTKAAVACSGVSATNGPHYPETWPESLLQQVHSSNPSRRGKGCLKRVIVGITSPLSKLNSKPRPDQPYRGAVIRNQAPAEKLLRDHLTTL
jgi:hypothetical protein